MKKILLSCVTCLLALGLVTACDSEDEVTGGGGGDSTTQDTGTGGGGDTTQGGGTTEATSLSNYTLSFTLTGEEIPDYATLYITGDWNDWGFEALEVGEGVYTYTFDTITVDWHNFKLVMWYSDEEVDWDSGNYVEVVYIPWIDDKGVTQLGNDYFEVSASQGDDYILELTREVSATLEEKLVAVTGVSIAEGTSIVMAPNETKQLTAVVTPSNATDQSVTWAVKDEGDTEPTDPVVSVDQTGLVTAGANMGTATIEVTTTDGGYTAETEVYVISAESIIEDYTLTIALGEGVTIPDYAELYLLYNGSYTLLEFSEGTATASLGSVVIGTTITYSVYLDYSEEYRAMEGCPEVTDSNIALSDTHTVAEGETSISGVINSIPTLVDPETSYQEVKIQINIYKDDALTAPTEVPEYLDVYIQWTLDENWASSSTPEIGGSGQLVEDGNGNPYTYAFKDTEALGPGHVYFTLYYEHASASSFEWGDYTTKVENLYFDVPYFYDGEAIVINICDWGIAEAIEDLGSDTNFYIVFLDTSGSANADSLSGYSFNCSQEAFLQNGNESHNWVSATAGTSSSSSVYLYTSSYGTLPANSSDWFSIWTSNGLDASTGTITIPKTTDGTYAVYVYYVDLTSTSHQEDTSKGSWTIDVSNITDFLAGLSYSAS